MAEMKFDCPKCQQQIACDELWGGHELQCPTCHAEIMVPQPGSTAPATASAAPGARPSSLVPEVPTTTKLSIGQARHQPMTAPPQASATSTTARAAAAFVKKKEPSKLIKVLQFAGFLAVLGVAGYFGWNWYQQRQAKAEEEKKAAAAQAAAAAAPAPAEPPMVAPQYTLDVTTAKIPEGKVNGMIAGTNFVAETVSLGLVGPNPVLSIFQGQMSSPDRQVLVYLRLKPGEKWSGHTWRVSSDEKTGVPQVAKRWKAPGAPTPALQNYAGGYAMQLEFGQIKDGSIPGKIYLALPDNEHTVVAGTFKATTTFTEAAPAAATAAPAQAPKPPGVTPAVKAPPEQRYGVQ